MSEGEGMAPYTDDWREEARRRASTGLVRREPQGDSGRDRGRGNNNNNRDDSGGIGGRAGGSGFGGGGGGDGGVGTDNGNGRTSAGGGRGGSSGFNGGGGGGGGRGDGGGGSGSGRGGDGTGSNGSGGTRFNGNNNNNFDENDTRNRKNDNNGNIGNNGNNGSNGNNGNNGQGGRSKSTDNGRGGSNTEASPAIALSPQDTVALPATTQDTLASSEATQNTSPSPAATQDILPTPAATPDTTSVAPLPATDTPTSIGTPSSTVPPSSTDNPTSILNPSTVLLVSTITSTPSLAPVSTAFIPLMVTTALPETDPNAPRKGLEDPASLSLNAGPLPNLITGAPQADTNPTTTALAVSAGIGSGSGRNNTNNNNGSRNGDRFRGNGNNGNRFKNNTSTARVTAQDPVEPVLISVGSIGGFITVCFIVWVVWWAMKKSKARKNGAAGPPRRRRWPRLVLPDRVLGKIPFLRNRQQYWQNLDDSSITGVSPPSYKSGMVQVEPVKDFYAQEKTYQLPSRKQSIDQSTTVAAQTLPPSMAVTNNTFTRDTNVDPKFYQPAPSQGLSDSAIAQSPFALLSKNIPQPWSHQPQQSFSSTNAAQFGNMRSSTDETESFRSRMPDAYYNQSELARGPSDAYDPTRRQVNRMSQLSSISSGFGDGDIIMPDNMIKPPHPAATNMRHSTNLVGRFSWASQGVQSRRDTVYTQSSEDSPPRFRNISSWVNQQTGRVKRAQQRHEDGRDAPPVPVLASQQVGVPGIHNPPAEQSFNMMMGDDEMPRRVDDKLVSPPTR